jgi:hypothetical protein
VAAGEALGPRRAGGVRQCSLVVLRGRPDLLGQARHEGAPAPSPGAAPALAGMSLAEATAGAAERIRRADVEGGLAFFVDVVVGPGGWDPCPTT